MKLNGHQCSRDHLLSLSHVGEKTADRRAMEPLTMDEFCAVIRRSPDEMRDLISFEEPLTRRLSDLETSIRICDERIAGYRNIEQDDANYSHIDRPMALYKAQRNYSPDHSIHPQRKEDRSRYLNNREVPYFNKEPRYLNNREVPYFNKEPYYGRGSFRLLNL